MTFFVNNSHEFDNRAKKVNNSFLLSTTTNYNSSLDNKCGFGVEIFQKCASIGDIASREPCACLLLVLCHADILASVDTYIGP